MKTELLNLNQYNAERIMELPLYPGCKHESETLRYVCKKSNDCEKCMFNNINSVKK